MENSWRKSRLWQIIETLFMMSLMTVLTYFIMIWITPTTRGTTEKFFIGFILLNVSVIFFAILVKLVIDLIKKVAKKEKDVA